jgi:hypothetical protein
LAGSRSRVTTLSDRMVGPLPPILDTSMQMARLVRLGRSPVGVAAEYQPITHPPIRSTSTVGSERRCSLVEQFLDLVGGGGAADPGVELVKVRTAGDVLAYGVGNFDAAGVEKRQHRPGLTFGFALGLTFSYALGLSFGFACGVVAAGEVALVPVSRGGHDTLQVGSDRRRQRLEHEVSIQCPSGRNCTSTTTPSTAASPAVKLTTASARYSVGAILFSSLDDNQACWNAGTATPNRPDSNSAANTGRSRNISTNTSCKDDGMTATLATPIHTNDLQGICDTRIPRDMYPCGLEAPAGAHHPAVPLPSGHSIAAAGVHPKPVRVIDLAHPTPPHRAAPRTVRLFRAMEARFCRCAAPASRTPPCRRLDCAAVRRAACGGGGCVIPADAGWSSWTTAAGGAFSCSLRWRRLLSEQTDLRSPSPHGSWIVGSDGSLPLRSEGVEMPGVV